jgi:hypothetical protein
MAMVFYFHDKQSLQAVLERMARRSNGGVCESYNYCQHCEEPKCIIRKSNFPCADAFLASGLAYVRTTLYEPAQKGSHITFVKYQKMEEQDGNTDF